MTMTVQVLYPISDGSEFDYDYYGNEHLPMVADILGPHGLQDAIFTKGLAGGPDTPPGFYAVATMIFPDEVTMNAGLAAAGPLLADIPNFTTVKPDMLIGTAIG